MASERRRSSVVQVNREHDGVLRVNDDSVRRMSQANAFIASEIANAKLASQNEKDLTIRDALKLYKKGVLFSLLFSLAVIMEGLLEPPLTISVFILTINKDTIFH